VFIDPRGGARHVPHGQRDLLLHLHQALQLEMVAHHLEYVNGLEAAWRKSVVERGAAQGASHHAEFDAAAQATAAGRAVAGAVQRLTRSVRGATAPTQEDGMKKEL
jgi:hypothetical protein